MVGPIRHCLLLFFAAGLLAACETPMPVQTYPDITFDHLSVLGINVAEMEVVSTYQSPMASPNVEYRFPVPPETALRRWATDRLKAKGAKGSARFTILRAEVIETPLEIEEGLAGTFKTEQSERYDAKVEATLEILDAKGFRKAFATAHVFRSRTVGENASISAREQAWFSLTEALMRDFDAEMEKNIRAYVGGYLM